MADSAVDRTASSGWTSLSSEATEATSAMAIVTSFHRRSTSRACAGGSALSASTRRRASSSRRWERSVSHSWAWPGTGSAIGSEALGVAWVEVVTTTRVCQPPDVPEGAADSAGRSTTTCS